MKFATRILLLVVLTLTLLASAPNDKLGRSANCRMTTAAAANCPRLGYTTFYTDATKTVACGWFDACPNVGEGCVTEFQTVEFIPCCDPPW